jgi:hypothetical protein
VVKLAFTRLQDGEVILNWTVERDRPELDLLRRRRVCLTNRRFVVETWTTSNGAVTDGKSWSVPLTDLARVRLKEARAAKNWRSFDVPTASICR